MLIIYEPMLLLLGMCYIFCMNRTSVYVALDTQGGKRGVKRPLSRGFGGNAPRLFFTGFSCSFLCGFLAHGFLFPVKELGLLTNPGHWIGVLDAFGSYMYIVL
jgi:hypothetical protein